MDMRLLSAVKQKMTDLIAVLQGCAIFVTMLQWSARLAGGIAIDNGVSGMPDVVCDTDHFAINFNTANAFNGKVFVKGYAYQPDCYVSGGGGRQGAFALRFNQCGVGRRRQPDGSLAISATVIVSFHPILVSKVDRAYRVNCFYRETRKPVTQHIDVAMLTTELVSGSLPMPDCKYEILAGSADGTSVRYARVGDKIYHKWSCVAEGATAGAFCMRVHTCTVDDGQGGRAVLVLDENGCSLDDFVLQNLEYTGPLMAGQQMHVYKFADRPTLYYNCQIDIKLRDEITGCADVSSSGGGAYSVGVRPDDGTQLVVSSYYNTADERLPADMKPASPYRLRSVRKWRSRRAADAGFETTFDLPETVVTVLDFVDEPDDSPAAPAASGVRQRSLSGAPTTQASVLAVDAPAASTGSLSRQPDVVCMTSSRFAGYAMALVGVASTTVALVIAAFVRRRHVFVTDLTGKKSFDRF